MGMLSGEATLLFSILHPISLGVEMTPKTRMVVKIQLVKPPVCFSDL